MSNDRKIKDNNKLYIAVFTAVIVLAIIVVCIVKFSSGDNQADNTSPKATAAPVSVVATEGSPDETIKKNIRSLRNVKFGKSHTAIQKFEKNNDDTLTGNYAAASDGTAAYLTCKFNTENAPDFFGTKVVPTDVNALLEYVFNKDDQMYEIRLQYGSLSKNVYDSIISNISGIYGKSTYSRTYSHGSVENWWKTKKVTLTAYYQESGVSVYLRKN